MKTKILTLIGIVIFFNLSAQKKTTYIIKSEKPFTLIDIDGKERNQTFTKKAVIDLWETETDLKLQIKGENFNRGILCQYDPKVKRMTLKLDLNGDQKVKTKQCYPRNKEKHPKNKNI